ncbi:hypothetical protein L0M92_16910, partial [Casaltella massiliensis]|nr:hypothetical protein [Casaltella massiliensis]
EPFIVMPSHGANSGQIIDYNEFTSANVNQIQEFRNKAGEFNDIFTYMLNLRNTGDIPAELANEYNSLI